MMSERPNEISDVALAATAALRACDGIPIKALEAGVVNRLRLSHAELLATLILRNASGPAIDEARALIAELGVEMASTTLSERGETCPDANNGV